NLGLIAAIPLGLKATASRLRREGNLQILAGLDAIHGVSDQAEMRQQGRQRVGRQFNDGDLPTGKVLLIPEIFVRRDEHVESIALGGVKQSAVLEFSPATLE